MDRLPRGHVIAIDASYGDDNVSAAARAAVVIEWVADHPDGCVLPTPRYGRSAELLAIVPGSIALAPGMREALRAQIGDRSWLVDGAAELLTGKLDAAVDWHEGAALPRATLLCDDGMGMAGVSRAILVTAREQRHPTLFNRPFARGQSGSTDGGRGKRGMAAATHAPDTGREHRNGRWYRRDHRARTLVRSRRFGAAGYAHAVVAHRSRHWRLRRSLSWRIECAS
jgi:hypothetical protein